MLLAQNLFYLVLYEWANLQVVAGFLIMLLLLIALLGLRLAADRRHVSAPAAPQRPATPSSDEEEAPEASPGSWADTPPLQSHQQTPPPSPITRTPKLDETNTTGISPSRVEALESVDPKKAAEHWGAIGYWDRAAQVHIRNGNEMKSALIFLGLQKFHRAVPLLRKEFNKNPADEKTRLLLVQALFDSSQQSEAQQLINAVLDENSPVKPTGDFLESVGRIYETLGDLPSAIYYYKLSLQTGDATPELNQRVPFLKQYQRLSEPFDAENSSSAASEFLERAIRDSTVRPIPKDLFEEDVEAPSTDSMMVRDLHGHEIIVGHLAFGFCKQEPVTPVGSIFSLARRFSIQSTMKETETGVTFEAVDRMLDHPVALKLVRLAPDTPNFPVLRDRLRRIAQLNHPNLAKVTFVDRDGPMLRIATEFLPGGNLKEYLTKLGGAGAPLIIRLCMYLASALYTSHLRGVPHGDIRPENILIGTDQRIKLIDYALSPIPVYKLDPELAQTAESTETPKMIELMAKNEGVQSDIYQFGDIIEFMLESARPPSQSVQNNDGAPQPLDELRQLSTGLRNGEFNSVLRLWQVLEQVFQRAVPPKVNKNVTSDLPTEK